MQYGNEKWGLKWRETRGFGIDHVHAGHPRSWQAYGLSFTTTATGKSILVRLAWPRMRADVILSHLSRYACAAEHM